MALTDKLTSIADAIRGKTGKTDGLTLEQMPGEIEGIQTGGGGDTSIEDGLVTCTLTSYSNDRITTVGRSAFMYRNTLASVSLPNLTIVNTEAFQGCTALTHVSFPNVTELMHSVFRDSGLKTFYLPKVTKIGGYAFRGSEIERVTAEDLPAWDGTFTGNWAFATNSKLKYFQHTFTQELINFPFEDNRALEKVDLCTCALGGGCFRGCISLTALILRRADAICELTDTNAFNNTPIAKGTGYVYVPAALIETYKSATNWSNYANQFRAIEDYPEICEVGA